MSTSALKHIHYFYIGGRERVAQYVHELEQQIRGVNDVLESRKTLVKDGHRTKEHNPDGGKVYVSLTKKQIETRQELLKRLEFSSEIARQYLDR